MGRLFCVAAFAALASNSWAADLTRTSAGATYFNRAGADMAALNADLTVCHQLASRLHQPIPGQGPTSVYVPNASPVAAGVGGAIGMAIAMAIQQANADRKGRPVNVENCMVVKGWQVVALTDDDAKTLAAGDKKTQAAQMAAWVGAAPPKGTVARVFENEVITNDWAQTFAPAGAHAASLSDQGDWKKLLAPRETGAPRPAYIPPVSAPSLPKRASTAKPPKPLTDADLGGVADGMGLIVMTVPGDAEVTLSLERMGPKPDVPAWIDGKPSEIVVTRPQRTFAKPGAGSGATYVFSAAPGRWRLASIMVDGVSISLCLGGPAFDLGAGDAVYSGFFGPSSASPDKALATAKAAFPGLSTVPDKLRPAPWINGAQGQCDGTYLYALEMPDRPYLPSYTIGSRAHVPSDASAAAMPAAPVPVAAKTAN